MMKASFVFAWGEIKVVSRMWQTSIHIPPRIYLSEPCPLVAPDSGFCVILGLFL